MKTVSHDHMPDEERPRITRRRAIGSLAAAPLLLNGCGKTANEAATLAANTPTPAPTQAEPTPTQPPISSPVPGYQDPTRWKGHTLTIATAASTDVQDALTTAFFDAFARDTGATVHLEKFGRDAAANVASQVTNHNVLWDVMLIPMSDVLGWANQRLLTGIDYNVIDTSNLYPELTLQHGVAATLYSTTMMFSVSESIAPTSWADFFDLSRWGGTRALRRSPVGTLEFALQADGVKIPDLYPLDLERAFRKLDTIRAKTLFYEDSKQPVELVRTGQAGLAASWTVRTVLPEAASLVRPVWTGGMISADAWVVPRGSANLDVAMSFINYATRSVPTANFARSQPFGPVNKDAIALLRPDVVRWLPNNPVNLAQQFFENWSYWRDEIGPVTAEFEDWLLQSSATPVATPIPRS